LFSCFFVFCFCSCATKFKTIDPKKTNFSNEIFLDGVSLQYRYNILRERGNRRYANREEKKGVHIVAVKILNNSNKEIQIGHSANLHINNSKVGLLDPSFVWKSLKQPTLIYSLYFFLVPVRRPPSVPSGNAIYQTLYIAGPGLALSNMFVAIKGNKQFLKELKQYNLAGKVIRPGEEESGLVYLVYTGYEPLTIRME
jgi:hypothetical protein